MKAITPVIAVLLLLLVTTVIVGFAFGFLQRALNLYQYNATQNATSPSTPDYIWECTEMRNVTTDDWAWTCKYLVLRNVTFDTRTNQEICGASLCISLV